MDAKLVVAVDSTQVKKADDDLNKLAATAAKVESEISDLGTAGAAAAKGMSAMGGAAGGSVQQLTQAERIMQRAGLTAGQYSQAMGLLPAQLTDVVTSLASGMPVWLVAIQQGGQIKDSFNGIGNAARAVAGAVPPVALGLTAVGAAAVTAAVGLAKGEAETAAFNRAIILTGNAAGTTADQLRGMAIALGGSATEGAAAAALAEIAATGKIAADQIQAVATAALSMEQTTGKAVSDTVKEFVRLADEPAAASAKLNEQYNYLTTSVYEQIKALEDQGRTTEAAKLATDTYAEAIRERSDQVIENLGYVESAWNAIVGVTKRATDAIREFGRDQTISDQIADIDAKLTDAYSNMATAYSDADKAATQGYINRLNAQKTALQLSQNEANLQAGIDSLRAERTKQEIADAQARDRALSGITNSLDAQLQSAQRLTVEERTRQQLTKAGVDLDSEAAKGQLEKARQVDAASAAAKAAAEAEREGEKAKRAAAAADKKRAEEIQRVLDTLLPMEAAERKHAEQLAVLDSLVRSGDLSWQEYQVAVQNAWATLNKVEFDKAAQEMRKGEQEAKRLAAELQSIEDRLDPLGAAARKYQQEQAKLNAAIAKGGPEADKYRATLTKLEAEYAENQRSATAWGKWTESALERVDGAFADAWMNIGDGFKGFRDSLTNAFKQMLAELAHMAITKPIVLSLGAALGIGGSSQALASGGSGILGGGGGGFGLNEAWNAVTGAYSAATSGFGQAVLGGWQAGQGILGGLSGAASAGWSYGANALSGLGAGFGGLFGGGAAAAAAGAPAAGFGLGQSLVQGGLGNAVYAAPAGILGSGLSAGALGISGIGGALYGYQQAGWKGAATGGLGAAGGAILGNILLPGIGGIIGGALGGMLGGSLFGGDWVTRDEGLALQVQRGDLQGYNYEYQKKKGGLFGKNKKRYTYSPLNTDQLSVFDAALSSTTDKVFSSLSSLGLDINDSVLLGLNVGRKHFSTRSKSLEKNIEKWFGTTVSDALVRVSGQGIHKRDLQGLKFKDVEELSTALVAVNAAFEAMGQTAFEASISGAKLAKSLQDTAGGMDKLVELQNGYYSAFYSESERYENQVKSLIRRFGDLGLVMPATADGFRGLVEAQDLTTAAGREMYLSLLALAPEMSAFTQSMVAAANGLAQSRGEALEKLVSAYQREASELQGVVSSFDALSLALSSFSDEIKGAFLALEPPAGRLDVTRKRFDEIAAAAIGGDTEAIAELPGAGKDYAQAALANAGSRTDYLRELSRIQRATDAAGSKALSEREVAIKQLEAVEKSLKELGVVSESVLSLEDALKEFEEADKAFRDELLRQLAGTTDSILKGLAANSPKDLAAAIEGGFASLDANLDGILTAEELRDALAGKATDAQLDAMISSLDTNNDGVISALELQAAQQITAADAAAALILERLAANDPAGLQEAIQAGFALLDANADGMLTADELRAALGDKATDAKLVDVIAAIDSNKDGVVDSGEASGTEVIEELKYVQGLLDLNRDGTINGFEDLISEQATVIDALSLELKNQMTDLKLKTLTKAQMSSVLDAPAEDIDSLLRAADKNNDGVLTQIELDNWRNQRMSDLLSSSDRLGSVLSAGFASLDTRLDGQLTKAEIQNALLKDLGVRITTAQAGQVIGSVDSSNNGTVTGVDLITDTEQRENALDLAAILGELDVGKISQNALSVFGSKIQTSTPNFGGYAGVSEQKLERAIANATGVALSEFSVLAFADIQALAKNLGISKGDALGLGENVLNDAVSSKTVDALGVADARKIGDAITSRIPLPTSDVKSYGSYTESQLEKAIAAVAGVPVEAASLFTKGELTILATRMRLKSSEIPAFAKGGFHSGGMRLVGENGPELEITGPSRIYSASQTAEILRSGSTNSSADRLERAINGLQDGIRAIAKHTMQTAKRVEFLEKWDFDGLPETRSL